MKWHYQTKHRDFCCNITDRWRMGGKGCRICSKIEQATNSLKKQLSIHDIVSEASFMVAYQVNKTNSWFKCCMPGNERQIRKHFIIKEDCHVTHRNNQWGVGSTAEGCFDFSWLTYVVLTLKSLPTTGIHDLKKKKKKSFWRHHGP